MLVEDGLRYLAEYCAFEESGREVREFLLGAFDQYAVEVDEDPHSSGPRCEALVYGDVALAYVDVGVAFGVVDEAGSEFVRSFRW